MGHARRLRRCTTPKQNGCYPRKVIAVLDAHHRDELEKHNAVVVTAVVRAPVDPLSRELTVTDYHIRATFPKAAPAPKAVRVFE